jgi:hypothetical protein
MFVSESGEFLNYDDFLRRQKRLHSSDINLNINNSSHHRSLIDPNKSKRQKSTKHRLLPESSSLLSLPSLFSSSTLTNESSITLVSSANQSLLSTKRTLPDETAGDADDEKDVRDESVDTNRYHRYHHRIKQHSLTSEEDDEGLLLRNHRGMMDFMDRVSLMYLCSDK